jgi:hypothetical protein
MTAFEAELEAQSHGEVHRFGDWERVKHQVPGTGCGVYSVWDDQGALYVGTAGRNLEGEGLRGRLRSHASGKLATVSVNGVAINSGELGLCALNGSAVPTT